MLDKIHFGQQQDHKHDVNNAADSPNRFASKLPTVKLDKTFDDP